MDKLNLLELNECLEPCDCGANVSFGCSRDIMLRMFMVLERNGFKIDPSVYVRKLQDELKQ